MPTSHGYDSTAACSSRRRCGPCSVPSAGRQSRSAGPASSGGARSGRPARESSLRCLVRATTPGSSSTGSPCLRAPGWAGARPPLPWARDADVLERRGHHRGVVDVPARDHHPQRSASTVADQVQLGRQPAAGPADRVIRRLEPRILVIWQSPLCPASGSHRADAPARWSSRWKRPSRSSPRRRPASAPRKAASPRCRPLPTG